MAKPSIATECPKCNSTDLGKANQTGYGAVYPPYKMSLGSDVEHIVCTNCGYIIESYVKKPEKFKNTL